MALAVSQTLSESGQTAGSAFVRSDARDVVVASGSETMEVWVATRNAPASAVTMVGRQDQRLAAIMQKTKCCSQPSVRASITCHVLPNATVCRISLLLQPIFTFSNFTVASFFHAGGCRGPRPGRTERRTTMSYRWRLAIDLCRQRAPVGTCSDRAPVAVPPWSRPLACIFIRSPPLRACTLRAIAATRRRGHTSVTRHWWVILLNSEAPQEHFC